MLEEITIPDLMGLEDDWENFSRTVVGSSLNHLHQLDNTLHNTGSTIDRILVNTAPCFLRQCKWTSIIVDDPKKLYTSGISNHGMVQAKACFSAASASGEGIIPLPHLQHKMFPIIFEQLAYETRVWFFVDPGGAEKVSGGDY